MSRRIAESTLGRGWKAPAGTFATTSARASACTFTESAPYSSLPGGAATRSATSRWTRKTIRDGRGERSAWKMMGVVM
ncbi:MAG: hypothetical protein U0164_08650 [Gemmatimonadaceae bacterium]